MTTPIHTEPHRLWQLISPTLPVGAFQHSQGLESAIDRGLVTDEPSARDWIGAVFSRVVAYTDLPLLERIYRAAVRGDEADIRRWDALARACRETRELRDEDARMGAALGELAGALGEVTPAGGLGYVATFAMLAAGAGTGIDTALRGYAWAWCENQALVAIRAVPLGHLEGQRMLRQIADSAVGAVYESRTLADEDIGRSLPGFALAGMHHETQYSRVFRS